MYSKLILLLFIILQVVYSCALSKAEIFLDSDGNKQDLISIPISIYILDVDNGDFSSIRTKKELSKIFKKVNHIWAQAGIKIEIKQIRRLTLPSTYIEEIAKGRFKQFLEALGKNFTLPKPSLLNAFYTIYVGGVNGISFTRQRVFFVSDTPYVHDERVTSHEIGHIFGLRHNRSDKNRLMYSGTNGTKLNKEEIEIARYKAQLLLDIVEAKDN